MNTLYFEHNSYITGDMIVAALFDLIDNKEILFNGLNKLNLKDYKIVTKKTKYNDIYAAEFDVILKKTNLHEYIDVINQELNLINENIAKQNKNGKVIIDRPSSNTTMDYFKETFFDESLKHGINCNCHLHSLDDTNFKNDNQHIHNHQHNDKDDKTLVLLTHIIQNSYLDDMTKKLSNTALFNIAFAYANHFDIPIYDVTFDKDDYITTLINIVGAAILINHLNIENIVCLPFNANIDDIISKNDCIPIKLKNSPICAYGILSSISTKYANLSDSLIQKIGYSMNSNYLLKAMILEH